MKNVLRRMMLVVFILIASVVFILPTANAAPKFKVVALNGFGAVKSRVACTPPPPWITSVNISAQPTFDIQVTAPCQGAGGVSAKGFTRAISQMNPIGAGNTVHFLSSYSARAQALGAVAWGNWKDEGENESYWLVNTLGVPAGKALILEGTYRVIARTPPPSGWNTAYAGIGLFYSNGALGAFLGSGSSGTFYVCVPSGMSFGVALSSDAAAQAWSTLPAPAPSTSDANASASLTLTDLVKGIPGTFIGGCNGVTFAVYPGQHPK
jgi:hypothetical protein